MKQLWFLIDSSGAALAVFVITVPFLLIFIFGVVNAGMIISAHHQINSILNTGLLYTIRNPGDTALISTQMSSASSLSPLTVSATQFCQCSDGSSIACTSTCASNLTLQSFVTLNVSTSVPLAVSGIIFTNPHPIQATATIRTN